MLLTLKTQIFENTLFFDKTVLIKYKKVLINLIKVHPLLCNCNYRWILLHTFYEYLHSFG